MNPDDVMTALESPRFRRLLLSTIGAQINDLEQSRLNTPEDEQYKIDNDLTYYQGVLDLLEGHRE